MVKEVMEDWLKFKEDQYEDEGDLTLAIKEINQRLKELKWRKKNGLLYRYLAMSGKEKELIDSNINL